MAYQITLTDGQLFATVPDGTINTSSSMTLVGKNYAGYGAFLDTNFIRLLETGSNSTPPSAPLTGQLWWDTNNNLLKVYSGTGGFKVIGAATASPSVPTNNSAGDLWLNTSSNILSVYNGSSFIAVGPSQNNGTVTSVNTGTGLTGGPITSTGTISLTTATTGAIGGVSPDGTTITISPTGVISAVGGGGGNYGNANVAAYLPTFQGQIGPTDCDIGIGTPSPAQWGTGFTTVQVGDYTAVANFNNPANVAARLSYIGCNYYATDATHAYYKQNGPASTLAQVNGAFYILTTPPGTANSEITWTTALHADAATGIVTIGSNTNPKVGVGSYPSIPWGNGFSTVQIGAATTFADYQNPSNSAARLTYLACNYYATDNVSAFYYGNGPASSVAQVNGSIYLLTTNSGTAGSPISWSFPLIASPSGNVVSSGYMSALGFVQTSDSSLKENQQPLTYGLAEVANLNPITYNFIGSGNTNIGLLAQDVANIIPEVVMPSQLDTDTDYTGLTNHLGIDYSGLVPVLIKAIQELEARLVAAGI